MSRTIGVLAPGHLAIGLVEGAKLIGPLRTYPEPGKELDDDLRGMPAEDIADCIVNFLQPSHFYKTMASEQKSGLMQDVYKITFEGKRVYLKLQVNQSGLAVIVSFKEDESYF